MEGQAAAPDSTWPAGAQTRARPRDGGHARGRRFQAGTIRGLVSNGSGDVLKDLVVTLHGFDEMQSVITGTATLQADGSFIF